MIRPLLISSILIMGMSVSGCKNFDYSNMPFYNDIYPIVYPKYIEPKRKPADQPYTNTRKMPPTTAGKLPQMPKRRPPAS